MEFSRYTRGFNFILPSRSNQRFHPRKRLFFGSVFIFNCVLNFERIFLLSLDHLLLERIFLLSLDHLLLERIFLLSLDHLLLDSAPNIGPLISHWELDKFKNC
jgi:hypothetical protein